jgi:long-chain acyl-CoA synthetase
MLGNDSPYLIAYLAALAGAMVFVPLNTRLARPEVHGILTHAEPGLIITEDNLLAQVPETFSGRVMALSHWQRYIRTQGQPYPVEPLATADDVALIFYTSGTTGHPKGVMLTHQNIAAQYFQSTSALLGIGPSDCVACVFPLFHTAQHVFLQPPLTIGATVVIDSFSAKQLSSRLAQERVTIFFAVPAMYHILLQDPQFSAAALSTVRILAYGGSIMPIDTIRALKKRFPQAAIHNLYGQTENSPAVSGLDDRYVFTKPGSVGRPLPGMSIAIFDDDDHEVAPGVVGEVVTQGVNLMKGYYHDDESTALAVRGGWYHTGDLGYLDEEGFLYVIDRKKDMIIRGGQNVYPAEVENVLYQHPGVLECAVIGVPHPILGEEIVAVVVQKPQCALSPDEMSAFARGRIASYKIPVRYHFVDKLPHNASGKILKRELRNWAREGAL